VRRVRRANPQAAFLGMWFAHGLDHANNTTSFRNTQQQQAPVRAAGPSKVRKSLGVQSGGMVRVAQLRCSPSHLRERTLGVIANIGFGCTCELCGSTSCASCA
jgi:hypothetical protein